MYQAKMSPKYNVTIKHLDANGKEKKIWQETWLMKFLMKHKLISPFAPKIPFLFGSWAFAKSNSNLITNVGFAGMASRLNGSGGEASFTIIAIGIGVVAASILDTTLGSEITTNGGGRGAAAVSRGTTAVLNDTGIDVITYTFTGGFAVTESGVFNNAAANAGTLLARQVFAAVNVVNTDALQVTWKVDFS